MQAQIVFFSRKWKNKFLIGDNFFCINVIQIKQKNINYQMKQRSKGSEYKCSQIFGFKGYNEKVHEEDIVSVLKFDHQGNYVCLGDKAGRIIIFKACDSKKKEEKYEYYTEVTFLLSSSKPTTGNSIPSTASMSMKKSSICFG